MSAFLLHVDGASRGNPGPAAIGVSLSDANGKSIGEISRAIGRRTNNEAEYTALLEGLALALDRGVRKLEVLADSELVVRQMMGQYRVRHPRLKPLWLRARELAVRFESFSIRHVPREENRCADALANLALDAPAKD